MSIHSLISDIKQRYGLLAVRSLAKLPFVRHRDRYRDVVDRIQRWSWLTAKISADEAGKLAPLNCCLLFEFEVANVDDLKRTIDLLGIVDRWSAHSIDPLDDLFSDSKLAQPRTFWSRLGTIYRGPGEYFIPGARTDPDLPEEHELLQVWVQRFDPETVVLVVESRLTPIAHRQLRTLLTSEYRADVRFKYWSLAKLWQAVSYGPASDVRIKRVNRWKRDVAFRLFLYLCARYGLGDDRLPNMAAFTFQWSGERDYNLPENRDVFQAVGINLRSIYASQDIAIAFSESSDEPISLLTKGNFYGEHDSIATSSALRNS